MQEWQDERCLGLLCDVRVRETVDCVLKRSVQHWGKMDIIVNSTGYGVIGACEDQDDYDLRNQFSTNFLGTLHIIQLSLPYFRQQSAGRYLIFSSTSGSLGVPGLGPYCATKYAVWAITEGLRQEHDDIRTTIISPGVVATELGNDITDSAIASALTTWRQKSLTPDAIARAIRYALQQPEGVDINEVIVRPTAAGM